MTYVTSLHIKKSVVNFIYYERLWFVIFIDYCSEGEKTEDNPVLEQLWQRIPFEYQGLLSRVPALLNLGLDSASPSLPLKRIDFFGLDYSGLIPSCKSVKELDPASVNVLNKNAIIHQLLWLHSEDALAKDSAVRKAAREYYDFCNVYLSDSQRPVFYQNAFDAAIDALACYNIRNLIAAQHFLQVIEAIDSMLIDEIRVAAYYSYLRNPIDSDKENWQRGQLELVLEKLCPGWVEQHNGLCSKMRKVA